MNRNRNRAIRLLGALQMQGKAGSLFKMQRESRAEATS